ncbi:MAG: SRPBCC family protein [Betaproteobacteria bacterium]|nr:SRPBCC family protein [Betaproteobacteria bacterium]MDE2046836.1 SRPBCC family protein [Betaproteobacteria bacterium]
MPSLATFSLNTPARRARATRITTEVMIDCHPDALFDYVANPSHWCEWHPNTVAVHAAHNEPMRVGEQWIEEIHLAGRVDLYHWVVIASEPGERWVIGCRSVHSEARIVYQITLTRSGCRFTRTLEYRSHHRLWRLLDGTLLRWVMGRQSRRAMQRLKRQAEALLPE